MGKILIRLSADGSKSTTATEGFPGGACIRIAAPFRSILGEVSDEKHTAEFYEPELQEKQQAFE